VHIGQDVLRHPRAALARTWTLGNGVGGSAVGTAPGAAARRAHAWLIAAEPHGRLTTLLLRAEERVLTLEGTFDLACTFGPDGAPRGDGWGLLESFRLDPWPIWRYRCGGLVFERSVALVPGHQAVSVAWRHVEGPEARLTATPLVVARDPGALQRVDPELRGAAQGVPGRVRIETVPGRPTLTLWHNGAFIPARVWRRGLVLPEDGLGPAAAEDAFVPGYLEGALTPGQSLNLVAASEDDLFRALAREDRLGAPPPRTLAGCVEVLERAERARRSAGRSATLEGADFTARQAAAAHGGDGLARARRPGALIDTDDPWVEPLAFSLLAGLVRRGERLTVLASLPAGGERGGGALRAVAPLVSLRAFEPAREVLAHAVAYLNEGLGPESFDPADGTPRYGDPGPALWLVRAAELYVRRSDDLPFLTETLYPGLESIMQFLRAGTHHGVRVDDDGLLVDGEGAAARKRVGANALWSHALVAMAQLARVAGRRENGAFYLAWAREHQRAFAESFWDDAAGCLYESLGPGGPVAGISPSQSLALALAPPLLTPGRALRLAATLERELFTPWGLRDAPGDSTVRTEWLGMFLTAWLRAHRRSDAAQSRARGWLEALHAALRAHGGHLPERFELLPRDADDVVPRPAGGASMVAAGELLRAWIEEFDHDGAAVGAAAVSSAAVAR
jgi:glycogen debranching enzyme